MPDDDVGCCEVVACHKESSPTKVVTIVAKRRYPGHRLSHDLLAQLEIAAYPDSRNSPGTDAPANDLALYTNTSPGKAVRVREASVF
jgi:hypothetical protein